MSSYTRPRNETEKLERRLARYSPTIALVDAGEAPEQTIVAVQLLREGLTGLQIAEHLRISRSRVYELLNDPFGVKTQARKARGQRPCIDCGAPCNTDGSVMEPSKRCVLCARARASAEAKWQPQAIIAAIQRWADEHGAPPKSTEWFAGSPYTHLDYFTGDWPAYGTVADRFGSFNAGLEAAGFKPRKHGGQGPKPLTKQQLADTHALVEEYGLKEAAKRLGLSKEGVKRRLKKHAGKRIGGGMPKVLTAETIIERELAKTEAQAAKFREDLAQAEEQTKRLKVAQQALTNGTTSVADQGIS